MSALDWRWPFVAATSRRHSFVIEPIAQVIAQPYGGNPPGLPNEDSAAFEFDENKSSASTSCPATTWSKAARAPMSASCAEAIFPGRRDRGAGGPDLPPQARSDLRAGFRPARNGISDIVGRVSVKFPPYLDLTDRIDIDRGNGTVRRHEIYLTGTYDRSSLQVSYVQLPAEAVTLGLAPREEINAQADLNFYENWQAFGAHPRDLLAGQMLDTEYGLGYEDECLAISLAYRRKYTSDRDLPPSTSIILRFTLKTGDQPIQPFSLFPQDVFTTPSLNLRAKLLILRRWLGASPSWSRGECCRRTRL